MSFSFGTPSSAPATTAGLTGFNFANKPATGSFGLSATPQASTSLFGGTVTTSTPAFGSTTGFGSATPGFGSTSGTPAFGATGGSAFGATSTAPTFGTAAATPAFGSTTPAFGTTGASAFGTTNTSFGGGLGTGGINFGGAANTSTLGGGLNFGPAAPKTEGQGLGIGLFGATTTAATNNSLFGTKLGTTSATGTLLSTSVTPSVGLGGVGGTTPAVGGIGPNATSTADGKSEPPKQTKLPNEISTTVDSFKEFVKKQKSLSLDLMRVSIKPLQKVTCDAERMLRLTLSLSGEVSRARAHSKRVRSAAASALAAADGAARDTAGSEMDFSTPPLYVKELISELEQLLIIFRRQMDVADKQMQASPKLLTEQELTVGIRRMHESLVALAGRLQAVHAQVDAQKEQYLNLRKYVFKDPVDVFDTPSPSNSLDHILRDAESARKKTKGNNSITDSTLGSAVLSDPRAALSNLQQLAGPTPFTYIGGSTMSPFTSTDISGSGWQPAAAGGVMSSSVSQSIDNSSFNLQKPPGKRGKQ